MAAIRDAHLRYRSAASSRRFWNLGFCLASKNPKAARAGGTPISKNAPLMCEPGASVTRAGRSFEARRELRNWGASRLETRTHLQRCFATTESSWASGQLPPQGCRIGRAAAARFVAHGLG